MRGWPDRPWISLKLCCFLWRGDRARTPRHHFLMIEAFLLGLGGGGNTRCARSAIRAAHDIPARGEFSVNSARPRASWRAQDSARAPAAAGRTARRPTAPVTAPLRADR